MIGPLHGVAEACIPAPIVPARAEKEREARCPVDPLAAPAVSTAADVERLYRSHGHVVLRWARTILGNEADAQEALQEVFAALLRSAGAMAGVQSAVGWLYGVTTHHCLNVLRNRRNGARLLQRNVVPLASVETRARADELAEVRGLIARLPEEVGSAVVYHYLAGMTYDEVAVQLGCSRRKVAYLLKSALERTGSERMA
jgi:RNA polymerase sigma-70 factor (ECF subfamily)